MKTLHLATIALFLTGCGEIYISDNGNGNIATADVDVSEESTSEGEDVTTITTTTTTTVGKSNIEEIKKSPKIDRRYKLYNDNAEIVNFVGSDYCNGISFRTCYLGSAFLNQYDDGSFKISLEMKDSFKDQPISIKKDVTSESKAYVLFEDAKIASDNTAPWRKLWGVLNLENKSFKIVYDFTGAGPGNEGQGVEVLDVFFFEEIQN